MDNNFGIPQISKFIDNLALFDGSEDAIKKYAEKIQAGKLDNLSGVDLANYKSKMAVIKSFFK
ncbi:MAG: hypothetical protein SFY32_00335 [Bacteroidota bacterium]|nr:hypothetical protein [Bacteroidota bacterium]